MLKSEIPGLGPIIRKVHLRLGDQLGLAIVRGDFPAGALLPSEAKLCEMMGVSRTAMREAIRGLAAKSLVESRSKIGTRVLPAENWNHLDADVLRWQLEVTDTEEYLRKMFELRLATEPAASAIAAQSGTPADHACISQAFDDMVAAGADNALWVEADLKFHKAIYLATHNQFFWPIGKLFNLALKEMFTIAARGSHRARAVEEHRALMQAIIDGRSEVARALSLKMVENAAADIVLIQSGERNGKN
ncbi:FadR/GntR family transcriptional regulator [Mesorhizobium sp. PUT5]|uniref:FadR/GntR family transcriptional regulator n=1 Tax=Mesorhizobium sp. PUT5 TaxID=3454629 RepID=UPI003FA4A2E4